LIEDLFVPVITPFDRSGHVDRDALAAHCAWTVAQGARGVMLFGTTGEGPSISVDEKIATARALTLDLPAVEVIGSVTENSTTDAVRCARGYNDLGLAAVLVLPPFYFREGSGDGDGLVRFFEVMARAARIPLMAYHIPGLAPAVPMRVLADLDLWGAKDSGGDLAYTRAVLETGKSVMVGAEATITDAVRGGASGTIAGMGNLMPGELARICAAARAGDDTEANRLLAIVLRVQAAVLRCAPDMEWIAAFKQIATYLHRIELGGVREPLMSRADYLTGEVLDALARRDSAAGLPGPAAVDEPCQPVYVCG
jgi:4-hydroxy-tetrahydrodipicolinate synthase